MDLETGLTNCAMSLNQRRDDRKQKKATKTYDNQLDVCYRLFDEYKTMSPGHVKRKIPAHEKNLLFAQYGAYYVTMLHKCYDNWLQEENDKLRTMTYFERLEYIH